MPFGCFAFQILHPRFMVTSFGAGIFMLATGENSSNPTPASFQKTKGVKRMKINKFITIAAIALMAIGAIGFASSKVHAQSGTSTTPQVLPTEAPESPQSLAADTDTAQVQEQVGDQSGVDSASDSSSTAADLAGEEVEPMSKDGNDAAPTGTPTVSADAALKAAQAYLSTSAAGTVTLDDENGVLVYSVDLNGSDVKVDALSGAILGVDQVGGDQVESTD
jgi:uncharacterized membrane protein YkoI